MSKHKRVFKEAVSEMKHFLMGAALVLTLVAVVPALAQMMPPPSGGSMMPPPSGGNMMPPPSGGMQQGGQLGPSNILPGGGMTGTGQQPPQASFTNQFGQGMGLGGQGQGMGLGGQGQGMGLGGQGQGQGFGTQGQKGLNQGQGAKGGFPGQGQGVESGFPGQGQGVESGFPGQGKGVTSDSSAIPSGFNIEELMKQFNQSSSVKSDLSEEEIAEFKKQVTEKDTTIDDYKKTIEEMEGKNKKEKEAMLKMFQEMVSKQQGKQSKQSSKQSWGNEEDSPQKENQGVENWTQKGKSDVWDMKKFQKFESEYDFNKFMPKKGTVKLDIKVEASDDAAEQLDLIETALVKFNKIKSKSKVVQNAAAIAVQLEQVCSSEELECTDSLNALAEVIKSGSAKKIKQVLTQTVADIKAINEEEADAFLEEE